VKVILDKSQRTDKYSSATFLYNQGIPVKIDAKHTIAHNKVMIIDGEAVITGSFNFTKAAEENNAENPLIIHDKKLAERYIKNWQEHDRHSEVFAGKAGTINKITYAERTSPFLSPCQNFLEQELIFYPLMPSPSSLQMFFSPCESF
jgi:phosphatidylserine/phosphatidylglycerophosphate/cardiolipin synthase-like enzyme